MGGRALLSRRRRLSALSYLCGFCALLLCYGTWSIKNSQTDGAEGLTSNQEAYVIEAGFEGNQYHGSSRHLLFTLPNCTPPAIVQFPKFFTQEQRRHGACILCVLLALYSFIGLAIACDDYFVPSLERISEVLKIQPDVAGATFMAAGSSAPELATAVIGVFVTKDDIGLGAVVGSAVFNILFVISVCALFAGAVVYLHWWPLVRDSIVYLLCILALSFIIMDEQIFWYESLSLLLLYILYIVLMVFNPSIEYFITSRAICCPSHAGDCPEEMTSYEKQLNGGHNHSVQMAVPSGETDSEESGLDCENQHSLLSPSVHTVNHHCSHHQQRPPSERRPVKRDDEEPDRRLVPPEGLGWRVLWYVSLPLIILLFLTIPDTRRPRWRRWYAVTFIMSCVWISVFSYVMVWMITVTGHTFHVPDTVMGLTLIAAGVSVPDAIASLMVVREGQGDMAVSNAIGSNVFDILVCLGLPWFLKTCVIQPNSVITVYSAGLFYASITLFSTVFFLVLCTWMNGWKLTRKYGVILMIAYVLVTVLTTLYEMNIFGFVHPAECPT